MAQYKCFYCYYCYFLLLLFGRKRVKRDELKLEQRLGICRTFVKLQQLIFAEVEKKAYPLEATIFSVNGRLLAGYLTFNKFI